jgi:poly-gamma-glutamate synthesis protein (capsule biosynthesis protein)
LTKAGDILLRTINSIRIGILALAEHEFSIATKNSPSANPLDLIEFVRSFKRHRDDFDYVIVLLHCGKEHYPYPSPKLQKTCHFMVEEGANAVICQHSHCTGCYEDYAGGHIVYGPR